MEKTGGANQKLILMAMIFAVSMTFIDQTIASMHAQISLGESASETGLYLLIFFAGFFVATQRGFRPRGRDGSGAGEEVPAGTAAAAHRACRGVAPAR